MKGSLSTGISSATINICIYILLCPYCAGTITVVPPIQDHPFSQKKIGPKLEGVFKWKDICIENISVFSDGKS